MSEGVEEITTFDENGLRQVVKNGRGAISMSKRFRVLEEESKLMRLESFTSETMQRLVVIGGFRQMGLRDLETSDRVFFRKNEQCLYSLKVIDNHRLMTGGSGDLIARDVRDPLLRKGTEAYDGVKYYCRDIIPLENPKLFASCNSSHVLIWEKEKKLPIRDFREHDNDIYRICIMKTQPNILISAGWKYEKARIRVFDWKALKLMRAVYSLEEKNQGNVWSINTFIQHGKEYLITGDENGSIIIWDIFYGSNGRIVKQFVPGELISGQCYSILTCSQFVLCASNRGSRKDGFISIYDLKEEECIQKVNVQFGIQDMIWVKDERNRIDYKQIVCGGGDKTVVDLHLWDVSDFILGRKEFEVKDLNERIHYFLENVGQEIQSLEVKISDSYSFERKRTLQIPILLIQFDHAM